MTTKTQPTTNLEALETAIIKALTEAEIKMHEFPALSVGDLKETSYTIYREINPKHRPHKVRFTVVFNELLLDMEKRHLIKCYRNQFCHQYRLFKPTTTPIAVLTKKQLAFIYDYARKTIDAAQGGYVDQTAVYVSTHIHTTVMSEKELADLMDLAAKLNV